MSFHLRLPFAGELNLNSLQNLFVNDNIAKMLTPQQD
jgi:hypothetical protein